MFAWLKFCQKILRITLPIWEVCQNSIKKSNIILANLGERRQERTSYRAVRRGWGTRSDSGVPESAATPCVYFFKLLFTLAFATWQFARPHGNMVSPFGPCFIRGANRTIGGEERWSPRPRSRCSWWETAMMSVWSEAGAWATCSRSASTRGLAGRASMSSRSSRARRRRPGWRARPTSASPSRSSTSRLADTPRRGPARVHRQSIGWARAGKLHSLYRVFFYCTKRSRKAIWKNKCRLTFASIRCPPKRSEEDMRGTTIFFKLRFSVRKSVAG